MNIAFFTDTYYPQVNGLVTSIATAQADLERAGHRVQIYAPYLGPCRDEPGVFRLAGFVYIPQPEYTFVLPWGKGFSLRRLKSQGTDLVHSHAMFGSGLVAWYCAWRQNLPLLMTYHTLFEDYLHYVPLPKALARGANRLFTRWMCDRCALVLAPTPIIRDVLLSYGTRSRVEVLPTGLDETVFAKTGADKAAYGVAPDELLVSCAGRTGREKNMGLLIDALASVAPRVPPFRLVIAGDGPERAALERRIRDRGLAGRATILGYLPRAEVLDLMEASDLFAFPSVTETQGMVVLEAMGRGTPVLGADAMGVGWMMRQGARPGQARGGWLAKPSDQGDFARLLESVLGDARARAEKSREAEALAGEYRSEALNRLLGAYYEELMGNRKTL